MCKGEIIMKIMQNPQEAKEFVSENIKNIQDQAFAAVLRDIVFDNNVDWHKVAMSISRNMPETNVKEEK